MHGSATELFNDILDRAHAAHEAEERSLQLEKGTAKASAREPILVEREATHGDFEITANISQILKETMRSQPGWQHLNDVMRESLDMNATKIARILSGNPREPDHWIDIAGYAKLVSERL